MKTLKFIAVTMVAMAIMSVLVVYTGCKKDPVTSDPTTNPSTSSALAEKMAPASDNSRAQSSFDDANNIAEEGALLAIPSSYNTEWGDNQHFLTSCAHINVAEALETHTVTIDFSTTDCLGRDGNYRRGKIVVTWTGIFYMQGTVYNITFDNYYLNFNKVDGTIAVTNNGRNGAGHWVFNINVNGSIAVDPMYSITHTAGTITFSANLTKELMRSEEFLIPDRDDVFNIWGTASGTTLSGVSYTASIDASNPLKKARNFLNFIKGVINITAGTTSMSIDFSYLDGNRDNLASVTTGGQTYIIHLDSDDNFASRPTNN